MRTRKLNLAQIARLGDAVARHKQRADTRGMFLCRMRAALGGALLSCCPLLATFPAAPAHAQDTANSSAAFWVEEAVRQRARSVAPQRVRRLMPRREFARPTIWNDRSYAARPPAPTVAVPLAPLPAALPAPKNASPSELPVEHAALPIDKAVPGTAAPSVEPQTPAPPPMAATAAAAPQRKFTIGVAGDSLAQWLAIGLADTFPATQGVTVVSRARDSSGLVRDDFFDWPKALREFVNTTPMDALVIMVGSNDRQPLRGANGSEEPLSKGWEAIYGKRVEMFASLAAERKIPVFWVGLPVMKSERFTFDMAALNDIYRARAGAAGAHFIDTFDAFSDEKGQYSAFGPDVNGTIVKLRATDGVHFTLPGARKLAHFLEGDIRKLRDPQKAPVPAPVPALEAALPTAVPRSETAIEVAPKPIVTALPALPERPAIGPVMPLTAAPAAPRGELLGAQPTRLTDAQRLGFETQADRISGQRN